MAMELLKLSTVWQDKVGSGKDPGDLEDQEGQGDLAKGSEDPKAMELTSLI